MTITQHNVNTDYPHEQYKRITSIFHRNQGGNLLEAMKGYITSIENNSNIVNLTNTEGPDYDLMLAYLLQDGIEGELE